MAEKRADERAREKLQALRDKMTARFGEEKTRKLIRIFKIALIVLAFVVAAILFVRIRTIEVKGDVTMFNESEVVRAAETDFFGKAQVRSKET